MSGSNVLLIVLFFVFLFGLFFAGYLVGVYESNAMFEGVVRGYQGDILVLQDGFGRCLDEYGKVKASVCVCNDSGEVNFTRE